MKREDLIAQLELLPEGAEVYVLMKKGRIAEPYLCFYDVDPHPAPMKLVAYIETFYDEIIDRVEPGKLHEGLFEQLTEPCHAYLHHVCHHGRSILGTCGECDTYEEELEDEDSA